MGKGTVEVKVFGKFVRVPVAGGLGGLKRETKMRHIRWALAECLAICEPGDKTLAYALQRAWYHADVLMGACDVSAVTADWEIDF